MLTSLRLVRSANTFLGLIDDFYTWHIKDLHLSRRIKIAVLDTGIDESDKQIKAARISKKRPIREMISFVGGSTEDTYGHGTHVAALLMKVAPEADIYVAKVAQEKKFNATNIVKVRTLQGPLNDY